MNEASKTSALDRLSLKALFTALVGTLVLGFVLYGTVSWFTLDRLRVNGPIYKEVVRSKDLIADILPPPAYIIEANLIAHELLAERSSIVQQDLIDRLSNLQHEFEARISFWSTEPLGTETHTIMDGQLVSAGREFYRLASERLVPAVVAQDTVTGAQVLEEMQRAYITHREAVDAVVALAVAANKEHEAHAEAALENSRVTLLAIFFVSVCVAISAAAWVAKRVLRKLGGELAYAVTIVRQLSQGDLRAEIVTVHAGDSLLGNLRDMVGKFREVLCGIHAANIEVNQSILQISSVSKEIAVLSNEQQREAESVASATEELRTVSDDVYSLATNARQNSETVEQIARAGLDSTTNIQNDMGQVVGQVQDSSLAVEELVRTGAEINVIVGTIKSIASQTNLLALNAAIEAARAGEQGRGFAVVADEVRALANRTGEATTQIEQIVGGLNERLARTTDTMIAVGNTVVSAQARTKENGQSIHRMADQAMEGSLSSRKIEEASVQQVETLSRVQRNVEELFGRLRKSASTLEITNNISQILQGSVLSLQKSIAFFQVNVEQTLYEPQNSRRRHLRVSRTLYVTAIRPQDGARVASLARDFSIGGIRIESPCVLGVQTNDEIDLEIKPPADDLGRYESQPPTRVRARVARCNESDPARAEYGMEFVDMDNHTKAELLAAIAYYTAKAPDSAQAAAR